MVVTDPDPLSPAAIVGPFVRVPPPGDRDFLPTLLGAVEAHGIDVLVPLGDDELALLASSPVRAEFADRGCTVVVSDPGFVALADDKVATVRFAADHGFATPATWTADQLDGRPGRDGPGTAELPDRLFVRPRRGHGSAGAHAVPRTELRAALARTRDPFVQAYHRGAELTVDALLDLEGRPIHYVARLRLRVEAGRSTRAVTVDPAGPGPWILDVLRACGEHGARGLLCLQAFHGPSSPVLIEINARAAHGLPLAIAAGGDHPAWLLDVVAGHRPSVDPGAYRVGVTSATYAEPVFGEPQ